MFAMAGGGYLSCHQKSKLQVVRYWSFCSKQRECGRFCTLIMFRLRCMQALALYWLLRSSAVEFNQAKGSTCGVFLRVSNAIKPKTFFDLCSEIGKRFLFGHNLSLHVERERIDCETDSKEIPARAGAKKSFFLRLLSENSQTSFIRKFGKSVEVAESRSLLFPG
ncbi:hypothetical protein SAEN111111_03970 [Saccharibacillus endophyticus]